MRLINKMYTVNETNKVSGATPTQGRSHRPTTVSRARARPSCGWLRRGSTQEAGVITDDNPLVCWWPHCIPGRPVSWWCHGGQAGTAWFIGDLLDHSHRSDQLHRDSFWSGHVDNTPWILNMNWEVVDHAFANWSGNIRLTFTPRGK